MACIPKSVLSTGANCKENPAGLSNHLFAVPLDANFVQSISVNDAKNEYIIIPASGAALLGYRIDFKGQTGQVTSEDNGLGKGWTHTGTGRVELSEDDMSYTSRVLHNTDKFIYLFPTGNVSEGKKEYRVVGNQFGDTEWAVTGDTGAARGDDHGQTFTVTCPYMLYPTMKCWGYVEAITGGATPPDDDSDGVTITDEFIETGSNP